MVALQGLTYNYVARVPGEKFLLEDRGEDRALWEAVAIALSPSKANQRYRTNGRWLEDEIAQEHYAQCCERDNIAALGFFETPQDTAPTVEAEAEPSLSPAPHARPGAPKTAERHNWTLDSLVRLLREGYKVAKRRWPNKKYINADEIAAGAGYSRKYLYQALTDHQHNFKSIRPFIID